MASIEDSIGLIVLESEILNQIKIVKESEILDQIVKELGVNKNEISGRITELKETCYISELNETQKSTRSNSNVTVYEPTLNDELRLNLLINSKAILSADIKSLEIDLAKIGFWVSISLIKKEIKKTKQRLIRINKELNKIKDGN